MSEKLSRGQRVYGLRRLTLPECARLLDISEGRLKEFIFEYVPFSVGQWSKWKNDVEQVPLEILQKFLESTHPLAREGEGTAQPPATGSPPGGGRIRALSQRRRRAARK
jgi:hypothetical protein